MATITSRTVRIRGPDGGSRVYAIERVGRPGCLWAARLTAVRKGKKPARTYTVRCDGISGWRCDCPSATVGDAKRGGYSCKHAIRCAAIAAREGVKVATRSKPPAPSADELLRLRLRNPFHPSEVKWKPQTARNDKAMAVGYIDARAVMDRLDEVVGVGRWKDEYRQLPDGTVVCRLSLRIEDEWVSKEDVGGESEQPDEHDRRKAAFSDALKRAAVKFGVGRYLYHLPRAWVPYDAQKRRLLQTPALPDWALPQDLSAFQEPPPPEAAPEPDEPAKAAPQPEPAPAVPAAKPKTLAEGVLAYDARLAGESVCAAGELFEYVKRSLADTHGAPEKWQGDAAKRAAWEATQSFERTAREGLRV